MIDDGCFILSKSNKPPRFLTPGQILTQIMPVIRRRHGRRLPPSDDGSVGGIGNDGAEEGVVELDASQEAGAGC